MTTLTSFLTACPPRPISQAGDQYAAELIRGIREELATPERAADFLHTTHLTSTTKDLLRRIMDKMEQGPSSTSPTIFQLFSRYGGGKTHGMLVIAAAAKHPNLSYWKETAGINATSARTSCLQRRELQPHNGNRSGRSRPQGEEPGRIPPLPPERARGTPRVPGRRRTPDGSRGSGVPKAHRRRAHNHND